MGHKENMYWDAEGNKGNKKLSWYKTKHERGLATTYKKEGGTVMLLITMCQPVFNEDFSIIKDPNICIGDSAVICDSTPHI